MFYDELERNLVEERMRTESLQAWTRQVRNEARRDQPTLRRRALLWLGSRLIATGSKLTERFGAPDEPRYIAPHDRIYNP